MDKEFLEKCIADGMSLPEIGRIAGRDPSTVGYWVKRYGLVANGRGRYAPRGGLSEQVLRELVEGGASLAEIARELDRSHSTVRYWLKRYDLLTKPSGRRAKVIAAHAAGERTLELECRKHGHTKFARFGPGFRCLRCNSENVVRRRRRVKQILIEEAGGRCVLCGYDQIHAALHFHHLDPSQKSFTISQKGATRGIDRVREEARKCVLLCANCHAGVEAGELELPLDLPKAMHPQ